ncbi:MAG: glycerol uptake facilitator-like aquaporin, partial [Patiriisocius sp.]
VDSDLDLTTVTTANAPTHGTASVNPDGTITYLHNGNTQTSDSYTYTISDTEGAISNEATVTIVIDVELGITGNETHATILLYPNPAENKITFNLEISSVIIYNHLGQQVLLTNTNTVDVSGLNKGLYFAKVTTNQGVKTLKFIKK